MPLPIAPTSARCQRCPRNPVMLHFCSSAGLGWPCVPSGARAHPRRARSYFSLQRAFFQPRSQPAPRGPRHGVGCGQARPCRNPSVALQTSPGAGARLPHAKPNRAGISSGFVLSLAGKKKKKKYTKPTFHAPWHLGAALGHAAVGRRCEPSPGRLVPKCGTPARAGSTGWAG